MTRGRSTRRGTPCVPSSRGAPRGTYARGRLPSQMPHQRAPLPARAPTPCRMGRRKETARGATGITRSLRRAPPPLPGSISGATSPSSRESTALRGATAPATASRQGGGCRGKRSRRWQLREMRLCSGLTRGQSTSLSRSRRRPRCSPCGIMTLTAWSR
ncbi:hypothetical protein T484DRAFT_1964486 [Baffinella frigidus]|nr:hypothetical protein T484DRAFT_1964486 [Cryptophyta sp. CCMP2293]